MLTLIIVQSEKDKEDGKSAGDTDITLTFKPMNEAVMFDMQS